MAQKPEQQEIKINLSPEIASGKYANVAVIAHSPNEVCLDFVAVVPNAPEAQVVSRIIMAPENAKNLLFALRDNIAKYESVYGEIERKMPKNNPSGNKGGDLPNPFMA